VDDVLDLRGQQVDEAIFAVDRFLAAGHSRGAELGLLIHGHGTGALRSAVRIHVKKSPLVLRSRPGTAEEGGEGVTVVGFA
jgi:DNA mismatch repair protein MutS2